MPKASLAAASWCARRHTATGAFSSKCIGMATKPNWSIPPNYERRCGRRWNKYINCTTKSEVRKCSQKMRRSDMWCHHCKVCLPVDDIFGNNNLLSSSKMLWNSFRGGLEDAFRYQFSQVCRG